MKPIRTALLISGSGTTARAILEAQKDGKLPGTTIGAIIASTSKAAGIGRLAVYDVPIVVIERALYPSSDSFGQALLVALDRYQINLVSQNGWLPLTPKSVVEAYRGRIINQHPGALDPGRRQAMPARFDESARRAGRQDFGGKGMFGKRVIAATLIFGALTGLPVTLEATTHLVTPEFDNGLLLRTERVAVRGRVKPVLFATLSQNRARLIEQTNIQQKVLLPHEHHNVIETLKLFLTGSPQGGKRPRRLIPTHYLNALRQAKTLATELFPEG